MPEFPIKINTKGGATFKMTRTSKSKEKTRFTKTLKEERRKIGLSKINLTKVFPPGVFVEIYEKEKKSVTFKSIETASVGSCFFESLWHHLRQEKYEPLPTDQKGVRQQIVQAVIHNWHIYSPKFVQNYGPQFQEELDEMGCHSMCNEAATKSCKELYRKYMTDNEWGTSIELQAACNLYGFECITMKVNLNYTKGIEFSTTRPVNNTIKMKKCFLQFTGSRGGGHFRYLKPIISIKNPCIVDGVYTYDRESIVTETGSVYDMVKVYI